MNIRILNSRGIKKEVELNEYITIGKAKEKLNEIGNQWMYNGKILGDDKTLLDYDIEEGNIIISITQNIPMDIRIKLCDNKGDEKTVVVDLYMTIKEAKEKYDETDNLWMCNGDILDDEKTFEYYGIKENYLITSMNTIVG